VIYGGHSPRRTKSPVQQALALPPEQRPAFLDEACAGDTTLGDELASLLAHYDQAPDFFDSLLRRDDLLKKHRRHQHIEEHHTFLVNPLAALAV